MKVPRAGRLFAAGAQIVALASCRGGARGRPDAGGAPVASVPTTLPRPTFPPPPPRELPADLGASFGGEAIDLRTAAAWGLASEHVRVTFSTGQADCEPHSRPFAERSLDVTLANELMPDGSFRWRVKETSLFTFATANTTSLQGDLGGAVLDPSDPASTVRGTLEPMRASRDAIQLSDAGAPELRLGGSFVARGCGMLPSSPRDPSPPARPEPALALEIAGHRIPVQGTRLDDHGSWTLLRVSSHPLDCAGEVEPEYEVLVALMGPPTGATLLGWRMPMQCGDRTPHDAVTRVSSSERDADPTLTAKVEVDLRMTTCHYPFTLRGVAHPLTCKKHEGN